MVNTKPTVDTQQSTHVLTPLANTCVVPHVQQAARQPGSRRLALPPVQHWVEDAPLVRHDDSGPFFAARPARHRRTRRHGTPCAGGELDWVALVVASYRLFASATSRRSFASPV